MLRKYLFSINTVYYFCKSDDESCKPCGNFIKTESFSDLRLTFFLFLVRNIFLKTPHLQQRFFLYILYTYRNVIETSEMHRTVINKKNRWKSRLNLLDGFASAMSNSFQSSGICGLLLNSIRSNMFTTVHRIRANLVDAFRFETLLSRGQNIVIPKYLYYP